jgi:hypothetical protein
MKRYSAGGKSLIREWDSFIEMAQGIYMLDLVDGGIVGSKIHQTV